jgi:hypothetical protein
MAVYPLQNGLRNVDAGARCIGRGQCDTTAVPVIVDQPANIGALPLTGGP